MTAILAFIACATPPTSPAAVSVPLTENATLTLASVEKGQAVLGMHDTYIMRTTWDCRTHYT